MQKNSVPFFDLKEQNRVLRKELDAVFRRVVDRADFILGGEVETFEKNFAKFTGTRFAVGVSSGLDALSLALRVLGIGRGDEVIVPANSFIATALAVTSVGAEPVFCDAEPERLLMDLNSVKKMISRKTKAVIPVHLYGQPVPMAPLLDLCRGKRLEVVEDAAQAHGASIGKKRCGSFGRLGCFSFYPGKNLGAFGDGGMVTTDDRTLADKLRLFRNYGSVVKYQHTVKGFNMRLDALQAAVLDVKLRYLERWNQKREQIARLYDSRLKKLSGIRLLKRVKGFTGVHHQYVIRLEAAAALRDFLGSRGIGASIHYPVPIHRQEAYRELRKKTLPLPVAENEAGKLVSLPMYPEMRPDQADAVCSAIRDFLESPGNF